MFLLSCRLYLNEKQEKLYFKFIFNSIFKFPWWKHAWWWWKNSAIVGVWYATQFSRFCGGWWPNRCSGTNRTRVQIDTAINFSFHWWLECCYDRRACKKNHIAPDKICPVYINNLWAFLLTAYQQRSIHRRLTCHSSSSCGLLKSEDLSSLSKYGGDGVRGFRPNAPLGEVAESCCCCSSEGNCAWQWATHTHTHTHTQYISNTHALIYFVSLQHRYSQMQS